MDIIEITSIQENKKPLNTRVRSGCPFQFPEVTTEFFSVQGSRIVTLILNMFHDFKYICLHRKPCFILIYKRNSPP